MRCLWAIAVSLLLAAAVPMAAQHGGGHASGGGHGGFGGHAGGFSGGHSFGGHSFGGSHSRSSFAPRSFSRSRGFSRSSRGPIASRGFNRGFNRGFHRGRNGGTHFRIRTYGYGNNCYGYGCRWGYGGWGYPYLWGGIDPYWWWDNDSDSGYDPSQPYNYDNGLANQMQQQQIPLRPPEQGDQGSSARSAPAPQHHVEQTEIGTSTVLVFRDQHREEVRNYAIVGLTLWTFDPQHFQRIPLSDLDLAATAQVNDDRGVEFRIPGA